MSNKDHNEFERVFEQSLFSPEINVANSYVQRISDIYFTKFLRVRRTIPDWLGIPFYKLTIKFNTKKRFLRREFEYDLPDFIGSFLFDHVSKQMHKQRTHYLRDNHWFEHNRYLNLAKMQESIIEIEFKSEKEAKDFSPTQYKELGKELTGIEKYRNYNLYKYAKEGIKWRA